MQLTVNDKHVDVADNLTIDALLTQLNQSSLGLAVAVNQQVIARADWQAYRLQHRDTVLFFRAIAGG